MCATADATVFWCAVMMQFAGIASMLLARLSHDGFLQVCFQRVFMTALLVVGCVTMLAVGLGSDYWLSLAVTLSLMVIGAVLDFGPTNRVMVSDC